MVYKGPLGRIWAHLGSGRAHVVRETVLTSQIILKQFQKLVFENLTESIKPRIFENEVY